MPKAYLKKDIPCTKDNLIKMVLDIEKYPEFVPWCIDGKIHSKNSKGSTIEIIADLTIGKSFFKETYKSLVIYDKNKDSIFVTNIGGPIKHLENRWFFKDIGKKSQIDFHINFELKNKILNILMKKSFDIGLVKIANAFENRASDLFNKSKN